MEKNLLSIPKKVNTVNLAPIKIEQDNNNYCLNINITGNIMTFCINEKEMLFSSNYVKSMSFQEIKNLNEGFSILKSINDFYDYLKLLSDNKKIIIKKGEEKISIILYIEVLLKKEEIEINLFPGKIDLNIKNICKEFLSINEKIKDIDILKNENKELKEKQNKEIDSLKEKLNGINEKLNEINGLKEKVENQNQEIKIIKEYINENQGIREKVEKQNKEINNLKE